MDYVSETNVMPLCRIGNDDRFDGLERLQAEIGQATPNTPAVERPQRRKYTIGSSPVGQAPLTITPVWKPTPSGVGIEAPQTPRFRKPTHHPTSSGAQDTTHTR